MRHTCLKEAVVFNFFWLILSQEQQNWYEKINSIGFYSQFAREAISPGIEAIVFPCQADQFAENSNRMGLWNFLWQCDCSIWRLCFSDFRIGMQAIKMPIKAAQRDFNWMKATEGWALFTYWCWRTGRPHYLAAQQCQGALGAHIRALYWV